MADGVDIDLYSDDIDQNFTQMKVCRKWCFIDFMNADMFFVPFLIFNTTQTHKHIYVQIKHTYTAM